MDRSLGVLRRYAAYLPLTDATPRISLGEGSTPLVRSRRIVEQTGLEALYFKMESQNPTASFKDRGMVVAVAKAMESGAQAVLCASTGNTSASAAAYAAACGLACYVFLPRGYVAPGKLSQTIAYGAQIVAIDGNFDDALRLARESAERHPIALVNSVNPYRIEGQKTAAFELVDDLGDAPEILAIPVGNAGNISAYWRGFTEYAERNLATRHPILRGFQAAGAAPLVSGVRVENPETIASAIRIGNPARWEEAMTAMTQSRGDIRAVTDEEILEAYRLLAAKEGVFCEPARAASVAGLLKYGADGCERIACVLTGHGLKDPQTALEQSGSVLPCEPNLNAVEKAVLG
jgi:threonine synthase